MSAWRCEQLTFEGDNNLTHAHSYYDIPVFDRTGRRIVAHRMSFEGRQPTEADTIEVGIVDADRPGSWDRIGTSNAWSWQQGPLAQWIAGGPKVVWNDNEAGRHVARLFDTDTRTVQTLPMAIYCVHPDAAFVLGVNMARLNTVRPGYGYPGGGSARLDEAMPKDDGIWRVDLGGSGLEPRLILPLSKAVSFMRSQLGFPSVLKHWSRNYIYWFNHLKLSPDGKRFTVKLRWRRLEKRRSDKMGVSLTCNVDGSDLRLLARATSHVIWKDDETLYFWKEGQMLEYKDRAPKGVETEIIAPGLIDANVHMRHLDEAARYYVLDTPYREEIDVHVLDRSTGEHETIAHFSGHRPPQGEFRCDLHPCPNPRGDRVVVTSTQSGGRQLYVLTRTDPAAVGS